jgi:hypothetical protein
LRRFSTLLTLGLLVSQLAAADTSVPLAISGHTTAGSVAVAGIRSFFTGLGPILGCSHFDSLLAGDIPVELRSRADSFEIPASVLPPDEPSHVEMWTALGCGHSTRVLVKLWYGPDGQERFAFSPVDELPTAPNPRLERP